MRDLKIPLKKFFSNYWPIILIFFLVVVFFWKFILLGQIPIPGDFVVGTYYPWLDYKWGYSVGVPVKNPITTDVVSFTYPMRILAIDQLRQGVVPLWNKYILTGTPLMANFQSAPFTLTNIYYFLFNNFTAWGLQVITQHFCAFIFTYILLRYLKVSKLASLFGGLVYAFSGFNLIWSQWNAHTLAASFIPLMIYLLSRWIDESKKLYLYLFSFVVFLQIISGYPQIVMYTIPLSGMFVLFKLKNKLHFKFWMMFGIALVLSLLMSAFLIFQSKELLDLSQRAIEPLEYSWAFLPWQKIITFIAPDYFGNHATMNYWGPTDYTTTTGYVGVVAFTLVCLSFFLKKENRKEVYFYQFVLFLSLILSFPTFISVFIWKEGFFGMQAASAHRALVLFTFSASILAAFALDKIRTIKIRSVLLAISIPGIILFLYGLFSVVGYLTDGNYFGQLFVDRWKILVSLRNMVLPVLFFGVTSIMVYQILRREKRARLLESLLVLISIIELFRFGWKFTPFVRKEIIFPTTPIIEFVRNEKPPFRVVSEGVIPINMKMPYKIESLEGYDAIYPVSIAQLVASINSGLVEATPQGRYANVTNLKSNIIDLLNVKYIIDIKKNAKGEPDINGTSQVEAGFNGKYKKVFEDKTTVVLENTKVIPRVYFYSQWEVLNNEDVLSKMVSSDFDPRNIVYLNEDPRIDRHSTVSGDYEYISYKDNQQVLKVTSSEDAVLFISDLNYPGWEVYVNDKQVKIINADYCFKAIPVMKGTSYVKLLYNPKSFSAGVKITLISLCVWIILMFYEIKISRKSR